DRRQRVRRALHGRPFRYSRHGYDDPRRRSRGDQRRGAARRVLSPSSLTAGLPDRRRNVAGDQARLRLVPAAVILNENCAADAAGAIRGCAVPPPQLTACPASARSPAAANEPFPPPSTAIFMRRSLLASPRSRRGGAALGNQLLEAKVLHLTQGIYRQCVEEL